MLKRFLAAALLLALALGVLSDAAAQLRKKVQLADEHSNGTQLETELKFPTSIVVDFSRSGSSVTQLKYAHGIDADTTTASRRGVYCPDSMTVGRVWYSNTAGTANSTINVLSDGTLLADLKMAGAKGEFAAVGDTIPAGEHLILLLTDDPTIAQRPANVAVYVELEALE